MKPRSRPPPKVLFVHNGTPYEAHKKHLVEAGFNVSETRGEPAVEVAVASQPDLVVLDFGCDGPVTQQPKANDETKHIPVIALVELLRR
jgi:DNA-binding response OmpR family regulator